MEQRGEPLLISFLHSLRKRLPSFVRLLHRYYGTVRFLKAIMPTQFVNNWIAVDRISESCGSARAVIEGLGNKETSTGYAND
jgi:hypothetical protein